MATALPTAVHAGDPHASAAPSPWVQRFTPLIAPGGEVLDLACGSGRHLLWLLSQGHPVLGVDRDTAALAALQQRLNAGSAVAPEVTATLRVADIESDPWPLPGRRFAGVVVANYLWRPLWPQIMAALEDGGVLIYETFAHGQQSIGRPARAEFLLQPGELLERCAGLRVVAFEDGFEPAGGSRPARFVQRIAALRPAPQGQALPRYGLSGAVGAEG